MKFKKVSLLCTTQIAVLSLILSLSSNTLLAATCTSFTPFLNNGVCLNPVFNLENSEAADSSMKSMIVEAGMTVTTCWQQCLQWRPKGPQGRECIGFAYSQKLGLCVLKANLPNNKVLFKDCKGPNDSGFEQFLCQ